MDVEFNYPGSGYKRCTGVLIRDHWVLTAAHCLFDGLNTVPNLNNNELYVSRPWISAAHNFAESYFINTDFAPLGTDFDDDYALIKLVDPYTGVDMDLSDHSDSTLQGVGAKFHSLQIPEWILNSADTCTLKSSTVVHSSNNDITAFKSDRLRWKGDITSGASGSALYFCPEGSDTVCGSGELGIVVSVLAGYNPAYARAVGPRVSEWFSWAQTIMNTN